MTLDTVLTTLALKIPAPSSTGSAGQWLATNGSGGTFWTGSSSVIAAQRVRIGDTEYTIRTGTAGAAGYITIGTDTIWIGTQECTLDLAGQTVAKIYAGTNLIYTKPVEDVVLFDSGLVSGYTWAADTFTRPNYTAYANGYITHVADGYLLVMVGDHDSSYSHNGHVTLSSAMTIPSLTRLNVTCHKTGGNIFLRFGVLPAGAANSYSIAAGGQLITETLVTSTADVTYSMTLNDTVKGQSLYPIINGRNSADAARRLVITKVWFD